MGGRPTAAVGGQKEIDPDSVPDPITVNLKNQEDFSKRGTYSTVSEDNPPLVATEVAIQDDGNASPRVMRSSLYAVPNTPELLNMCKIPFAVAIRPLAHPTGSDAPIPVVDHGGDGPIRCSRCKAYVNAGFKFVDGGRSFLCNMCPAKTSVPDHYFCNLDHTGYRNDLRQRPELYLGTVDYKVTSQYCPKDRPTVALNYLFAIDVSYTAVQSGLVAAAAQSILHILDSFPKDEAGDSEAKIGIMTFAKDVHFYNLKAGLSVPHMMVMSDVDEPFVPLRDGLLVGVEESREVINSLLEQLPHMFTHTQEQEPVLGSAVTSAMEALKYTGGKMMVFSALMPTQGLGKLKAREDVKLLGTDKEPQLLTPQSDFYSQQATKCVEMGVSADLFVCNSRYYDVSSIGMLSHATGGSLFVMPQFNGARHAGQLVSHVERVITRVHGYDGMMRVRSSMGLRPMDFCGAFTMDDTTNIKMAGCDEDKTYIIEIKHDCKLEEPIAVVQAALLFTKATGERVVRVHTLRLRTCSQIADIFRATDIEAVVATLAKKAVRDHRRFPMKALRERIRKESVAALASYRKHCTAANVAQGQLILPECLKLLPCYAACLVKTSALRAGGAVGSDARMAGIYHMMSTSVKGTMPYIYPRMIQLDLLSPEGQGIPARMRPSQRRLKENGVYLLENGLAMCVWIGPRVASNFCTAVLEAPAVASVDTKRSAFPSLGTPMSNRVREVVAAISKERGVTLPIMFVKKGEPTEVYFLNMLHEDKGSGAYSYVDFLCLMHKEIQMSLQ